MKLARTFQVNPALFNVIPLINVIFLVIVFFSLSSRFVLQPGMAVNLPVSAFNLVPQPEAKIVSVTAAPVPSIYFRDQSVTLAELRKQLDSSRGKQSTLIVRADRGTPYELVMQIANEGLTLGYAVILATGGERP